MVLRLGQRPAVQVRRPQFAEDGIAEAILADLFAQRPARLHRPRRIGRTQREQRRTEQEQGLLGAARVDHRPERCNLRGRREGREKKFSEMAFSNNGTDVLGCGCGAS